MKKPRDFRTKYSSELEELNTIVPFVDSLFQHLRWWIFSKLFIGTLTLTAFAITDISVTWACVILVFDALFYLLFWHINNVKNQRNIHLFYEYWKVGQERYFKYHFYLLLRILQFIRLIDLFFIFPVTIPIKFIWMIFLFKFSGKLNRLRKLIMKGKYSITTAESVIKSDPFYAFLKREGLYDGTQVDLDDIELKDESISEDKPAVENIKAEIT